VKRKIVRELMETPGVMHACEFSLFEMVTGSINIHRLLLRDLDP
jgi:hypothetical protein